MMGVASHAPGVDVIAASELPPFYPAREHCHPPTHVLRHLLNMVLMNGCEVAHIADWSSYVRYKFETKGSVCSTVDAN